MHGSSLAWQDEGEGIRKAYRMHRLERQFVLIDTVRGSRLWSDVYSLALSVVYEVVKVGLEKKGNSFREFPIVFENNHRELSAHSR